MGKIGIPSDFGLENHRLFNNKSEYWNLYPPGLVEQVVMRKEGDLANLGAVVVNTGQHTGRSPNDKFIVNNGKTEDQEIWWGKINQAIDPSKFQLLYRKMISYLQGRDVFVQDLMACAHPQQQIKIRVISEKAWASLFAHDLFIRIDPELLPHHVPDFTVLHCPDFQAIPEEDGTKSSTFIIINFDLHLILIGGTSYAGEIKKSIFSILNYILPRKGVLSMHCSANVGNAGDIALFFGLSGTGKTSLSSDTERRLIGDDEHGWSDDAIFNFEGGCYAKTINLSKDWEPLIWEATRRFGTVLENVVMDPLTRYVDFNNGSLTENTRAAYPIHFVPNHIPEGYVTGHPENVFFLTADAFGVMPPIARLTSEQVMYYFLSGYTSKLAGTEKGLGAEPQATFSACFGAPFLPLPPTVYAELLGKKIERHKVNVWLVNTGWTGGPYGIGSRIKLPYTRAMIRAVLTHKLDQLTFHKDSYFGLLIPDSCPEVPTDILDPVKTWKDPAEYPQQTRKLIERFENNIKQFEKITRAEIINAGPRNI